MSFTPPPLPAISLSTTLGQSHPCILTSRQPNRAMWCHSSDTIPPSPNPYRIIPAALRCVAAYTMTTRGAMGHDEVGGGLVGLWLWLWLHGGNEWGGVGHVV